MKEIGGNYRLADTYLGDVDGPMQARRISQMNAPVQAWYGTLVIDAKGNRVDCSEACMVQSRGGLADGIRSIFSTVFVVVDLKKVAGHEVGTIADYVSMLTLSQTKAFDSCRELPSITNVLATGCSDNLKAVALTDADTAYLRGLYKIDTRSSFRYARGDLLNEMEKSGAGK